jgi:hypothetical protein
MRSDRPPSNEGMVLMHPWAEDAFGSASQPSAV